MPVSEETHVQNIVRIKDTISKECSTFLINGFRLGVAQKALNLYLKYLWCLGIITPPPPHCPFDRIIIEKLPEEIRVPWTQINDVDTYLRLVEAAKKITAAQKRSLADWELNAYQG